MTKFLQVKVEQLYRIEVPDTFDFSDYTEVGQALDEYLCMNNMTTYTEFFEGMEVVCSSCGVSLDLDEEKKMGICVSCDANHGLSI